MPTPEMVSAYRAARERYDTAADELRTQLVRLALTTLAEVLPGADSIDALGEYNEDSIPTLRIQRVLSLGSDVLFDVDVGHQDRAVEDAVDRVDIEYLDPLIDLVGDAYLGPVAIGVSEPSTRRAAT